MLWQYFDRVAIAVLRTNQIQLQGFDKVSPNVNW
jgi:hypothetical protein